MKYYFAQHGKALSSEVDATRPLSPQGEMETLAIADTLKRNNITITRVAHSGKKRAQQTAQLFATTLDIKKPEVIDGLSPNDDVKLLHDKISSTDCDNTLFVGHLPHIEKAVSYLLTGLTSGDVVSFQNSAVLCIETNADNACILWYITPDII